MKLYCGVDLHSNNGLYAIVDEQGKRTWHQRVRNEPAAVVKALSRFRQDLVGVAIEATGNWYWLADTLEDASVAFCLANPNAIHQYDGLKCAADTDDAFLIAELYRQGCLPKGYAIARAQRPLRDLLRRRLLLVRLRTALKLSLQSLVGRHTGRACHWRQIEAWEAQEWQTGLAHDDLLCFTALTERDAVTQLSEKIKQIEQVAEAQVKKMPAYEKLRTIPGIGLILGMTIALETVDIGRFAKAVNYTSYCRAASAWHHSNGKHKHANNRKNGNKYLAWAFVEAAQHCRLFCDAARKFYERKVAQRNVPVATKALASKLSKAAFYIMRDNLSFDEAKMFG